MLKPIVSMNQMAMNESIATTCCYVWNGTSILGSASLPHGGQLKAGSDTTWYMWVDKARTKAVKLNKTWTTYTAGHITPEMAGFVRSTSVEGDVTAHDYYNNPSVNIIPIYTKATGEYNKYFFTEGFCDHKNPETCPYFSRTNFSGSFTHTGATSAHYTYTSGNSWLADHTAVQYSS